jgi:hypothetical protein
MAPNISIFIILAAFASGLQHVVSYIDLPVLQLPMPQIEAGSSIYFEMLEPFNCEFTANWRDDTSFLPTVQVLVFEPCPVGVEYAEVMIPKSVPSGLMLFTWCVISF